MTGYTLPAMNNHSTTALDDLEQNIRLKIRQLAYQKAELRGLSQPGHEAADWARAEQEVRAALKEA